MSFYLNFLKILLVFIVGIILLLGSGGGGGSGESSVSGDGSASETETEEYLPKEQRTIYAERRFEESLIAPFEIDWSYTNAVIRPRNHSGFSVDNVKKKIIYRGDYGYIGKDNFMLKVSDKNGGYKYKEYEMNIISPPLEENRDFTITHNCDFISKNYAVNGFSQADSIDMEFVDDNLQQIIKIYDDIEPAYSTSTVPVFSRIQVDFRGAENKEKSKKHHDLFKENIPSIFKLTCNYKGGHADLIFPIKEREEWNANRSKSGAGAGSYHFMRNDLFFYVSSLSDIHAKIYKKEYENSFDHVEAFNSANEFMDKAFPSSHYTGERASIYNKHPEQEINTSMHEIFDEDNRKYYRLLNYLALNITDGDVGKLNELIADSYYSYYLSGNKKCENNLICAAFFSEYTTSKTLNGNFEDGFDRWERIKNYYGNATGKIEHLTSEQQISLELKVNTPRNSSNPNSIIDFYQSELLNGNDISDYFFQFQLNAVYGGSSGLAGGAYSSGMAGAYTCFKDSSNNQLGCLTWIDHTDILEFGDYSQILGDSFVVESTDFFHVEKFYSVMRRRLGPKQDTLYYITDLDDFTRRNLPKLYNRKDEISSIEYGVFLTEARNDDGRCYFCDARLKATELLLLKRK